MSHPNRFGSVATSWLITLALSAGMIGGAAWWRSSHTAPQQSLPLTRKLVAQKVHSLEAYNLPMLETEILQFYRIGRPLISQVAEVAVDRVQIGS